MKKVMTLILAVLSLSMLTACNKGYRYAVLDASGNDATAVVKEYYMLMEEKAEPESYFEFYSEHLKEMLNGDSIIYENLTLVDFTHCEIVDESLLRESDLEFIEEHKDEYYAFCYVQTADSVYCEEDCATGHKGETVSRNYMYSLVMETEDSDWKIYDYGYPPFYTPE